MAVPHLIRKTSALKLPFQTAGTKPFQQRQRLVLGLYCILCFLSSVLFLGVGDPGIKAFALGLFAPGAGFLFWASDANALQMTAILAAIFCFVAFFITLVIWFATGNILLPPFVWLGSAVAAGSNAGFIFDTAPQNWSNAFTYVASSAALMIAGATVASFSPLPSRRKSVARSAASSPIAVSKQRVTNELGETELRHLRFLLDRALQPVDQFNGFERLDQFQTAAVRYQINFISYALSVAQTTHMPAFKGYLNDAQLNLAKKQQDHRIWRYWQLENLWGNLRNGADPVPKGNIMYTGFIAAQLAYFEAASGTKPFNETNSFVCRNPKGESFAYSLPDLNSILTDQYKSSRFGLLECEPNWVYPLCNSISATAIKASGTQNGTDDWDQIKHTFRNQLEAEFIRRDGRLVPIRTQLLGFAVPPIGGAVMQSFPCLFLSALFPDLAEQQWSRFKDRLSRQNWNRAFWPIDVGNYRFSRASSYTATLAAAVEMGDHGFAADIMEKLETACPSVAVGAGARLDRASLWSNALFVMARCGGTGMLSKLVNERTTQAKISPFIKTASYPNVLVAKAVVDDETLHCVLYPGDGNGFHGITLGGLKPGKPYSAHIDGIHTFVANDQGEARLNIPLNGRTELRIREDK